MIAWLEPQDPFPPLERALGAGTDAPGLLAASRDLTPQRLLLAYRQGIFPWYSEGQPVLWWSTDPRMVLVPQAFKISATFRKTLRRVLREPEWEIRVDDDFIAVMHACANTWREGQQGTWITPDIVAAYGGLHRQGLAHSVETWYRGERVGGLYGVAIGRMFYGESMFAHRTDASKIALAALCAFLGKHGVAMIDCQQETDHLASLGARPISRADFVAHVRGATQLPAIVPWDFDKSVLARWTQAAES
ncbi:leucyl/phenylalanyl-tRNA--protein transferase [Cupriavidus sp. USMAA2-4]|uniref:Leucyl/phenylalanyl-tRNA--protein transferase n=1 Tax=Cupriavidus malaysiensis TaxID=367825 RepID=A0ABM6Q0X9_9BURK|nr:MULTISPECIES: leucyl/phenylalanyl-tRNA--protein transferase [Cupriavidus]AOY93715.1 leucyl/phenylalanyl-tRNA--protein transferase [Cupriavidus sp. USMAA2-4]AOZ00009.1 leucyl/phenylalanyl-tRNA--protein transferase [Cupriavidus sp. USMAHM13]AOZ06622.1 leucyl/phenylalanyl-tRNA--protein transferase [Cupriavidus malaysiensis]